MVMILKHRFKYPLKYTTGAAFLGGGAGSGCRGTEDAGGGVEETRARVSRAGDRHRGERAEHHYPSDVPGETTREKAQGPLQEEPAPETGPRQQLYQPALWWVGQKLQPSDR